MVRAYHIIISCYGFWLPNDPRGSWSTWIRSWDLFRYGGPATKVSAHRSVAHQPHNRQERLMMKQHLKNQPVVFTGEQALSVAKGFAQAVTNAGYVILACAVLKDHAHLVVARDGRLSEQIRSHLKRAASQRLREDNLHPFAHCPTADETLLSPWARGGWQVYLNSDEDIARAIAYIEKNPIKEGLRRQRWSFVVPYDGC